MKRKSKETELVEPHAKSKRKRLDHNSERKSVLSQATDEVFKYEPLPASQEAFRLLRIKSTDRQGIILCEIFQYQASNCPDYIAISYCWGNENDTCSIRLNGQVFRVRRNLLSLLQNIGTIVEDSHLWIDAICVDQSSIRERNHQVCLMGQIYSGAREVIAWVGLMDEDSEKALTYLRHVVQYKGPRTRGDAAGSSKPQNTESLVALRRFLEREYWHRTWIIQEIILARKVRLICGTKKVKWSRLQRLQELWWQAEFPGAETARILDIHDCTMFRIMNQREILTPWKLDQLVTRHMHSKCQDPRDKIYALLSLAADCNQERTLEVDYKKSREQVFCDVLLFCKFRSPTWRMDLADTVRRVLRLNLTDIQAFVRQETTFTWNALTSTDRCVSIQRQVPAMSTNQLQEYEGLLLGRVSSVSAAYGQGETQARWDSGGSQLPFMDTIFKISGAVEARFTARPGTSKSGRVRLQFENISFACIMEGDLVYQLGSSRVALVYRPSGTDSGHLVAVAWTGNMVRASFRYSRNQRRTFLLSPSDVLGLALIHLPYWDARYRKH